MAGWVAAGQEMFRWKRCCMHTSRNWAGKQPGNYTGGCSTMCGTRRNLIFHCLCWVLFCFLTKLATFLQVKTRSLLVKNEFY